MSTRILLMCLALIAGAGWMAVAETAPNSDVRLLSSDERGVVIEYSPRYFESIPDSSPEGLYQTWFFEGARDRKDVVPGAPHIQVRTVLIAFPGKSGHTLEVLAADYEEIQGVTISPFPKYEGNFESVRRIYEIDERQYSGEQYVPTEVAALKELGVLRGLALGEVELAPIQYRPVSRTLRKHTRIVVRVNFGPAEFRRVQREVRDPLIAGLPLNYELAKNWIVDAISESQVQFRNSVFATGSWYRFTVAESGMYKLTGAALLAAGIPASTNPRMIKVFSNGGQEPPHHPLAPYPTDVLELAVYVHDGGTSGVLDANDYIIFYGEGPRGWKYNAANKSFTHKINLYSEVAHYWVTFGGGEQKRMIESSSLNSPSPFQPNRVLGKVFREDERVNVQNSGRQWLGQAFNPNDVMTYLFPLPGIDLSQPITYRFSVGARNTQGTSRFDISEQDTPLLSISLAQTGGGYFDPFVVMREESVTKPGGTLTESQSRLRFSFMGGSAGTGYIDWVEIFYHRQLLADADVFNFHSLDTAAIVSYTIGGFTSSPVWIFGVTRFDSVVRISNPVSGGAQVTFQTELKEGEVREFYVVGESGFKTPGTLQTFSNQNLHADTASVDLVIITHRDFLSAAQRLKNHREQPGSDRLSVRVVDVEQIYNEFSGGQLTPVGIRNYLRYLYQTSSSLPKYVLLFGDGDYDYKRISTRGPNWIPAWETYESFAATPLQSYATEDSLVMVTGARTVDMSVGRLPVRTAREANDVVSKIIEYETAVATDPWKLRATFVADDGLTSEGNDGTLHTWQAENLSTIIHPLFEKQKIYLAEYPTVITSAGRRKPSVNDAIIEKINQGTLLLNFTGHGNPRLWTHEHVFVRETDFPRMANKGKYFLLVAATCNYSQFDNPFDQSGGELIVLMPAAGAMGCLSATRAVFAGDNFDLNRTFYQQMFQLDALGRVPQLRLGDVFYQTKLRHTSGLYDNDKKFLLIGDPSLRFAIPRRFAAVDSMNNAHGDSLVQIQALSKVSLVAGVRDSVSNQPVPFAGTALVTVYDSERRVTISNADPFVFTYTASGGVIFRGQSRVESGKFNAAFIVPKDISYNNDAGRVSLYFWNELTEGAGVKTNVLVGGTNPDAPVDTTGPRIDLYLENRQFRPGDLVGENPLLIADLHDEHGINTSGSSIGHRLEAWINDNTESIDLSNFYRSVDSYQKGTIEYRLTGLNPGTNRLRLRAWDTYNNASTAETNFDVMVKVGLRVFNVFNYPNPYVSGTVFTFEHNQLTPIDVEIKIYTVAGRLIESITERTVTEQFVRVRWNGLDRDGNELANGVYLYKVIARTQDGRFTSEALGKLTKLR